MRSFGFVLLALFSLNSISAHAEECSPQQFLLSEATSLLQSHEIRLAFATTMSEMEFKDAKNKAGGGLTFPINGLPISAYGSSESAKSAARTEASARKFNLDELNSTKLIANRISEVGAKAYIACVEGSGPGLSLRVSQETNDFVTLSVLFRPSGGDMRVGKGATDNFKMLTNLDEQFPPNVAQSILFKRLSKDAGAIEVSVGPFRRQLIFPPILKLVEFSEDTFVSSETVSAQTGGCGKKGCAPPITKTACAHPPTGGWKFIPNSERVAVVESNMPLNKAEISPGTTPELVCWTVTAATPCTECVARIAARATVRMQRPVD